MGGEGMHVGRKIWCEDNNGDDHMLNVDGESRSLYVIDVVHARVHQGVMFNSSYLIDALADSVTMQMMIVNGSTRELHMVIGVITEGKSSAVIYEGGTVSANGSALSIINMNREKTNSSTAIVFGNPTFTTTGTSIARSFIPGGTVSGGVRNTVGGNIRQDTEIILKENEKYTVALLNQRGTTTTALIQMQWYEEV